MADKYNRRSFVTRLLRDSSSLFLLSVCGPVRLLAEPDNQEYNPGDHYFGMGIQVKKCIGCGSCVRACKAENDVPEEPIYFRTWVERYVIKTDGDVTVESREGGIHGFTPVEDEEGILRSFFVPKLCNQCDNPPCVQVCPVGATFMSPDGVILVDKEYCIGCRYCIQACPFGARYMDPRSKTADKCNFCYHRITKGLLPACVEICPTQARVFGEMNAMASPLRRMMRMSQLQTLKSDLNTAPKVFYSQLDIEVR